MSSVVPERSLLDAGIDALALKPSEVDLSSALDLPVDVVTVDFEGREHVPDRSVLADLSRRFDLRVTVPVRADGYDPLGDDHLRRSIPASAGEVLVAGNPAYLSSGERQRAIAPRLAAAREESDRPWVGTEGIERIALAVGGTQFDLLSDTTVRDARALRASGFDGELAVYAPTVFTTDEDIVLDALGPYVARRKRVAERLPADTPADRSVEGSVRDSLLAACNEYALVGRPDEIAEQIRDLSEGGVDSIVCYPARGLDSLTAP